MTEKIKNARIRQWFEANKDRVKSSGVGEYAPTSETVKEFRASNRVSALRKEVEKTYQELATNGQAHNRQSVPVAVKRMVNTSLKKLADRMQQGR